MFIQKYFNAYIGNIQIYGDSFHTLSISYHQDGNILKLIYKFNTSAIKVLAGLKKLNKHILKFI